MGSIRPVCGAYIPAGWQGWLLIGGLVLLSLVLGTLALFWQLRQATHSS